MWQDTGDTRETPAIDVCKGLIGDGALLNIYDPQVSEKLMLSDLSTPKFEWDHPASRQAASAAIEKQVATRLPIHWPVPVVKPFAVHGGGCS